MIALPPQNAESRRLFDQLANGQSTTGIWDALTQFLESADTDQVVSLALEAANNLDSDNWIHRKASEDILSCGSFMSRVTGSGQSEFVDSLVLRLSSEKQYAARNAHALLSKGEWDHPPLAALAGALRRIIITAHPARLPYSQADLASKSSSSKKVRRGVPTFGPLLPRAVYALKPEASPQRLGEALQLVEFGIDDAVQQICESLNTIPPDSDDYISLIMKAVHSPSFHVASAALRTLSTFRSLTEAIWCDLEQLLRTGALPAYAVLQCLLSVNKSRTREIVLSVAPEILGRSTQGRRIVDGVLLNAFPKDDEIADALAATLNLNTFFKLVLQELGYWIIEPRHQPPSKNPAFYDSYGNLLFGIGSTLRVGLRSRDTELRRWSAEFIGLFGTLMGVIASDVYRSLIDDDRNFREIVRRVLEQVDPEKDPKLREFKLSFLPYLVAGLHQEAAREFASHDWPLSRLKEQSYKYGYSANRFAPLVEDLLQEIAVTIVDGRFGFDPSYGKPLDAYLSRALRNSLIDDAKHAHRERLLEGQHPTFVLKEDHRSGSEINLAKLERLLIEKLEERNKRIFKLLYRERRTIAEIAKELNVQPESAKRAVSRCNAAIRKVLKELGLLEQLSIFTED